MARRWSFLLIVVGALITTFARAQAPLQPPDSILQVGAVGLHYQVFGRGPAVVLIHGFGETLRSEALSPLLAGDHQVVRFDVPGFGTSRWSGPLDQLDDVINDDIVTLLDHLHVSRADFVGTSMGSLLASRFAVVHPGRVHALILFDPMPLARGTLGPVIDTIADDLDRGSMLSLLNSLQPPGGHRFTDPEVGNVERASFPAHDPHVWATMMRAFPAMQLTPSEMHALDLPFLALSGSLDPLHPLFMSSASEFSTLRIVTLPDKALGGMASSAEMRRLVAQFIDSVDAARPQ